MTQKARQWRGVTYGGRIGQGSLLWLLSKIDPVAIYWLLPFIVPFYMLFNRRAFIAVYRYYTRRFGLSWPRAVAGTFRTYVRLGQCMLDKFAAYSGNLDSFELEFEGTEEAMKCAQGKKGIVIVSSHVGNFELAGLLSQKKDQKEENPFVFLQQHDRRFSIMVYAGETQTIQTHRQTALGKSEMAVIYAKNDMSHVFEVRKELEEGHIVCITCDRFEGSRKYEMCNLLGGEAKFPIHAFAMASSCRVPILSVFCMKAAKRKYRVYFKVLDEIQEHPSALAVQVKGNVHEYVRMLEEILRKYPEQWFNFYEFWQKDNIVKKDDK